MSDELSKLQRQLEQATAADCPPEVPLDAETASMREGWLALGQLLEAAQPAPDEPPKLRPIPRRTARTRWRLAGIAGLAASLVIGVTLGWSLIVLRHSGSPSPPRGGVASQDMKQPDELNWDDSLDQQIAQAGRQLISIQQDWYHLDDAFGPVHDGMEQMEKDIDDSTL